MIITLFQDKRDHSSSLLAFSPRSTFLTNANASFTHSDQVPPERHRRQPGSFITDGAESHALLLSLPRELQ